MKKNRFFLFIWLALFSTAVIAQENFTVSPANPKAGDLIQITYVPAGDIANTLGKVEGVVFLSGSKGRKADDLLLTKSGKKYTASIQTDTAHNFVQLGFYVGEKYDNNFNDGYTVNLFQGDKAKKGSHYNHALFYQFYGQETNVEQNNSKALAMLEKEISLYPEQKKALAGSYFRLMNTEKKESAQAMIQQEIESALKAGLKEESDYNYLETLYNTAKLTQQSKLINSLKKEKFPQGKWTAADYVEKFNAETDPAKKQEMLAVIEKNVATNKDWKNYEGGLNFFKSSIINIYAKNKQWDTYKKLVSELPQKSAIASNYNNVAKGLYDKNEDLKLAEEFAKTASDISRSEWKKPTGTRPDYATAKNWDKQRESTYANHADTYALILYKSGNYKKAFELSKEAAITINKGKDPNKNNTYALAAEKVLSAKELKPELEKFVKEGNAASDIKEILKRIYISDKTNADGFDNYIAALEKEMHLKMVEELRKSMINEASPAFTLVDLEGKQVSMADLKGKVVVVDFWATWCGPCKASFPGMQKMLTKFKDNADVKFVFIDTWERVDNKEKNAADFIASNKYTFHVLMDNDNKVVEQFKVEGIPTKFVIDKQSRIRFKSVGFDGSDDKLVSELSAMIEMASSEKTF